jgi:misacylated tRNA(Ala) deacylase
MTEKLYYSDPYLHQFEAEVVASEGNRCLLSGTAFYPGGGGQPCDTGVLIISGKEYRVSGVEEDPEENLWHLLDGDIVESGLVKGILDWQKRFAFMRYHGLLHIANAIAMRNYQGWITGVQIGEEYARIDFNLGNFSKAMVSGFEGEINKVIEKNYPISSQFITDDEFNARPELIRTLVAKPPVKNGKIRIVTIGEFDSQACGGTHVHSTGEIGFCRIGKFDNKGSKNKRFYFKLDKLSEEGAVNE